MYQHMLVAIQLRIFDETMTVAVAELEARGLLEQPKTLTRLYGIKTRFMANLYMRTQSA